MIGGLMQRAPREGTGQQLANTNPTTRQRLIRQKEFLESQLTDINACLSMLDSHPELEEFHNVLNKTNF